MIKGKIALGLFFSTHSLLYSSNKKWFGSSIPVASQKKKKTTALNRANELLLVSCFQGQALHYNVRWVCQVASAEAGHTTPNEGFKPNGYLGIHTAICTCSVVANLCSKRTPMLSSKGGVRSCSTRFVHWHIHRTSTQICDKIGLQQFVDKALEGTKWHLNFIHNKIRIWTSHRSTLWSPWSLPTRVICEFSHLALRMRLLWWLWASSCALISWWPATAKMPQLETRNNT